MAGNSVYKIQPKISGAFRGCIPRIKVNGSFRDIKQAWIKINGAWRQLYTQITWTYYWSCTNWGGCSRGDIWLNPGSGVQYRSCTCYRSPDTVVMSDSYCGTKPALSQSCNCNCNCNCNCCCD